MTGVTVTYWQKGERLFESVLKIRPVFRACVDKEKRKLVFEMELAKQRDKALCYDQAALSGETFVREYSGFRPNPLLFVMDEQTLK